MTRIFRIDNQIIERIGLSGCRICPIKLFERQHRIKLNLDRLPYFATGSRLSDNLIINRLIGGEISILDEINITYPLP